MAENLLKIKGTLLLRPRGPAIRRAAQILVCGGLVAFPTETVYGLGAAVSCAAAVERIFAAKGRPSDNPLIVHVAVPEQLDDVAARVPAAARELIEHFWPGPLSLVLPRSAAVPPQVSAGLSTVAVRMPAHPVALRLIEAAGVPVAAPSANRSGRPSPTVARHVLADLAGRIDAVLDGGPCAVGLESTVLDLTASRPLILRPGGVTREDLEAVLGVPVAEARWRGGAPPPSPGMKYRHYAPRAALLLITGSPSRRTALLAALRESFRRRGFKVGLLGCFLGNGGGSGSEAQAAQKLYLALRDFDWRGVDIILAEELPARGLGAALMNRLRKAATRVIRA